MNAPNLSLKIVLTLASGLAWLNIAAAALPQQTDHRQQRYAHAIKAYRSGQYQQAFAELIELAKSNYSEAQFRLGVMLHQGRGAPQNYLQARRWYRSAADLGHPGAQNNLGVIYRDGDGVRKNRIQAYMWFSLAASQMNAKAQANRNDLALDMNNSNILQAQQLTAEYMSKLWQRKRETQNAQKTRQPSLVTGFAVQLGLFTKPGNIERLRLRLADLGISLDNKAVAINGHHYRRLRVGPFSSESEAEQIAQRMDKLFKLKSAVTPIEP